VFGESTSVLLRFLHPLLHCVFVCFGDGAMKGGVCLFGLIPNINSCTCNSYIQHVFNADAYGVFTHGMFGWIKTNPSAIALLVWFI